MSISKKFNELPIYYFQIIKNIYGNFNFSINNTYYDEESLSAVLDIEQVKDIIKTLQEMIGEE